MLRRQSPGQKRFTRTRRAHKQHAFGDFTAQALEFLRVTQEVDDFFKLALGFLDTGNIFEGHTTGFLGQHLGLGFAKAHGFATAALHLAHEENPYTDDQKHREPADQSAHQRREAFFRLCDNAHALVIQLFNKVWIIRGVNINRATVARFCSQSVALDRDFGNLSRIHFGQEVRECQRRLTGLSGGRLKQVKQRHQKDGDNNPQCEIFSHIHSKLLVAIYVYRDAKLPAQGLTNK